MARGNQRGEVAALRAQVEALTKVVKEVLPKEKNPESAPDRTPPPAHIVKQWAGKKKVCPECGETKPVYAKPARPGQPRPPDFGFRHPRGVWGPQPYCRACRSAKSKEYYHRERSYLSKNNPQ